MHFSSVDLPEPLWPITPKTSPSFTSKRDVLQGDELVEAVAALGGDALLQRVGPLAMDAERLGEVIDCEDDVAHRYISSANRGESLLNTKHAERRTTHPRR